jgi:rhodanese-related sulfurtransferase
MFAANQSLPLATSKGSINIPVDQLTQNMSRFSNKEQPIITCCASGMRSAAAKSKLESMGYTNVQNGGGWLGLNQKLG